MRRKVPLRDQCLLEDSHYQPFAGIYNTYMIPNTTDKYLMPDVAVIKSVYASVYYRDSKAYMTATSKCYRPRKKWLLSTRSSRSSIW